MQPLQNAVSKRGMSFQKENMLFPRVFYPHKQSCWNSPFTLLALFSFPACDHRASINKLHSIPLNYFLIFSWFMIIFPTRHDKLTCYSTSNCNMPNRDYHTYSYLSLSKHLVWISSFCPKQKALLKALWDKKSSHSLILLQFCLDRKNVTR